MNKKHIILYFITAILLLGVSCTSDPEVLEFDQNFNPTPPNKLSKKEKEKLTPPVDLLSVYAFFQNTEKTVTINRNPLKDGKLEITENISPINLDVKLTIPVEEATELEIVKMETTDEAYPKIIKGLTLVLPNEAATIVNGKKTFKKGKKAPIEKEITQINLNKEELLKLNNKKQYALPVKIKVLKGKATIVNYFVLNIKLLDIAPLPQGNNIRLSQINGSPDQSKILYGDKISFETDYKQDHTYKLKDGNNNGNNWWVKAEDNHYLNIKTNQIHKIKGIIIVQKRSESKRLKSLSVEVSRNNGSNFTSQGSVQLPNSYFQYIEFIQAVKINQIKLLDFKSHDPGNYIDITEIYLIKE